MQDILLVCSSCGNKFMWSKEEQELYNERGVEKPKYCPICRGMIEAEKKFIENAKKGKNK